MLTVPAICKYKAVFKLVPFKQMSAANQSPPVKDNCILTRPAFSFMYSSAEDASWICACNDVTLV